MNMVTVASVTLNILRACCKIVRSEGKDRKLCCRMTVVMTVVEVMIMTGDVIIIIMISVPIAGRMINGQE